MKEGAVRDVGTSAGNVMAVGAFGVGGRGVNSQDLNSVTVSGIYTNVNSEQPELPFPVGGLTFLHMQSSGDNWGQLCIRTATGSPQTFFRIRGAAGITSWGQYYTTFNTSKSSDGTLKAASPVARIANPDSTVRPDIDEGSFEWCGYGVANSEAHGIEIIRDGVGTYRVTGAKSLASSGWRLLPPRDPNGSGDLGVVKAEERDDEIIITLFRLKMMLENGEIVIKPGEPIDVPANSWIDIRLDMPESAIPPESQPEEAPVQPE